MVTGTILKIGLRMKKKILILSSLVLVFACAAFDYKFYGVDTGVVPAQTLRSMKLVAGQKADTNKTMDICRLEPEESMAKCIVVRTDEFRAMRQEIVDCRTDKK